MKLHQSCTATLISAHIPYNPPAQPNRLLRELLEAAPGSVIADTVDTLAATGGSILKMVHTHDGAAAACMALAYGTPRDRKRLVKGMKGARVCACLCGRGRCQLACSTTFCSK